MSYKISAGIKGNNLKSIINNYLVPVWMIYKTLCLPLY